MIAIKFQHNFKKEKDNHRQPDISLYQKITEANEFHNPDYYRTSSSYLPKEFT